MHILVSSIFYLLIILNFYAHGEKKKQIFNEEHRKQPQTAYLPEIYSGYLSVVVYFPLLDKTKEENRKTATKDNSIC